ncbi:MAG: hypothetical protein PHS42_01400 [Sulfurimonas sp.]|jgi:hypothetical protein|nr:hypothetical protein [Sulfurimonas sp.]MDD3834103.1 hypothetical protein [Sulfurimonas sp.]MDY0233908.1 hypothetical protein [Sulfurimonas sp.]
MKLSFRLKHHFFSAFREFFVHHHGSLEFRAKIFALLISSNEDADEENYTIVEKIALDIYKGDQDRADLLVLTTRELVKKVHDISSLDIDTLVSHIQKELKIIPRYAKKIDIESLKPLTEINRDIDTLAYQKNILEFLQNLKDDTLCSQKSQIEKDEKNLIAKY